MLNFLKFIKNNIFSSLCFIASLLFCLKNLISLAEAILISSFIFGIACAVKKIFSCFVNKIKKRNDAKNESKNIEAILEATIDLNRDHFRKF